MAKVMLIKTTNNTPFLGQKQVATPPMGIMYIASVIREKSNHEVSLLDTQAENLSTEEAVSKVSDYSPDIIGISTLSLEAIYMHRLAKEVKKFSSRIKIIVGGPHATTGTDEILADKNIDYLILGEGEQSVLELIEALDRGQPVGHIQSLGYRENGRSILTPRRSGLIDLDSLPFPAWDLINLEAYYKIFNFNLISAHKRYMPIFTSRGCPYRCTYCHNVFGKKFRARSPENVMAEIEYLYNNYGIREFQIIDDNFNLDKKRAKKICDLIIDSGLKIFLSFPNALRGDIIDLELISKLKQAGAYKINYAIETASPRVQKLIKKHLNLPKLQRAIKATNEMNIFTHGFFMMGFPTETAEEVEMTIDFAVKSKLNTAGFYALNPFPGTEISSQIKELGIHVDFDWNKIDYLDTQLNASCLASSQLSRYIRKANMLFYLNPRRTYNTLKLLPNKKQLLAMIGIFLKRSLKPRFSRNHETATQREATPGNDRNFLKTTP